VERSDDKAYMPIQQRFRRYLSDRFAVIALLWAGVALAMVLGPAGVAVLQDKPSTVTAWISLSAFADWRLPVALVPGVALVQLFGVIRSRFVTASRAEERRAQILSRRSWDEVSAALTHVACASLMAQFMQREFAWSSMVAVLTAVLVGGIAYDVPVASSENAKGSED